MSSSIKPVAATVLAGLVLSACGTSAKPVAGATGVLSSPGNHAKVDDPRIGQGDHLACLQAAHLPLTEVGQTDLRIGTAPGDPTVHFTPTPGDAQGLQIDGKAQSAEVIGSALLYPHQASDSELKLIEDCLAQGVKG